MSTDGAPSPPGGKARMQAEHNKKHGLPRAVLLNRPVRAVRIPEGDEVTLDPGQPATLTQALGGSFTIQLEDHRKFRIEGRDADAIGEEVPELARRQMDAEGAEPLEPGAAETMAWDRLKAVHDPEIPIDIVDLGLVYTLKMHKRGDGKLLAEVSMSLTAPGCGMGDVLLRDVKDQLRTVPGVAAVDARITFDPVWNPNMMSDAAKLQLGLL